MLHAAPRIYPLARRALPALVLLAGLGGCSRLQTEDQVPVARAEIVFSNQSLAQADVYAVSRAGESVRLGTVQSGRTETLRVPSHVLTWSPVNFVARLLAHSFSPSSGPVSLIAGERVQLTLPQDGRSLIVLPGR